MKIINFLIVAVVGISAIASNIAEAKSVPRARNEDSRVREVYYDESQVGEVGTSYGFATTIEFGNETVNAAIAGDTIGWQIIPKGNRVYIKPAEKVQKGMQTTNLTIQTDKRNYYFHIYNRSRNDPIFIIRFRYDKPKQPPTSDIDDGKPSKKAGSDLIKPFKNFNYGLSGDKNIKVLKVFDDGQFTYFKFDSRKSLPVIYKVNSNGRDEIVNTRKQGEFIVVEGIAEMFTLRDGKLHKCVKNQSEAPIYKEYNHEPTNPFKPNGR